MFNPAYHTVRVRGCTLGDGQPKICVPIVAYSRPDLEAELEKLQTAPYDLVEYRADYYLWGNRGNSRKGNAAQEMTAEAEPDVEDLMKALERIRERIGQAPLLFTIRTVREGGQARLSYEEYAQWNLRAARTGLIDLADVEYFTAGEEAVDLTDRLHREGVKVIGSSHDFEKTPEKGEMLESLTAMQEDGMDISKLAVMPKTDSDVCRLVGVTVAMKEKYADRPFITMSMGRTGLVSRAVGAFSGSAVTFASAGRSSAPGQIAAADLKQVLNILQEQRHS